MGAVPTPEKERETERGLACCTMLLHSLAAARRKAKRSAKAAGNM